jgi:glucose-6-phosphate 1-epimerase
LEDGAELVAADASRPAVFARGVKGVSVTGPGAIVGAAASGKGESALMKFENCRNVRLDGFSVRAARGNIADFSGCSGVEVRALEALEARGDAFGIEKSEQLTFERCNIKKCRSVFAARSLKRLDARVCRVENAENIFFAAGGDKLGVEDVVLRYVLAGEIGNVFAGAGFDGAIRNLSAKNLRAKNIFGAVVDISGKADGIVVEEVNAEEIGRIAKLGVESGSSIGNVALKRIIGRRICRASVVRNAKDVKLDRKDISRAAKSSIAPDNKDVYVLENDRARAEISLKGARVVSWMGKGGKELLFMPERKYAENGDWSHGGIPLCWPWFGRVDGVIHGFVRNRNFTVKESGEGFVVLSLSVAENSEKSFPHAAQLDVRVSLDDKLALSMTTLNAGKKEFSLSCGYHPYFAVSGYKNIVFGGVAEKPFACEDGMDKAFDRRGDGKFGFCDRWLDRELSLRGVGNTHVVVWTPGNVEPCNRNLKPWETEEFIGYGPFVSKGEPKLVLKPGEKSTVTVEMQEVE